MATLVQEKYLHQDRFLSVPSYFPVHRQSSKKQRTFKLYIYEVIVPNRIYNLQNLRCSNLIVIVAFKLVVISIVGIFKEKTVCAQINVTGYTLPSDALDFLDPAQVISTGDACVLYPHTGIVNNLLKIIWVLKKE